MTTLAPPPQAPPPAPQDPAPTPAPTDHDASARWWSLLDTVLKWVAALVGALAIFSAILLTKGANPLEVYADAWTSTFTQQASLEQIFVKMAPFLLAALAVVVPARAGMVNVGGEGQVIMGAVAAAGVGLLAGDRLVGGLTIALMFVAGLTAGALWAGIAGLMRMTVKVNEAVSTLLLNYVALNIMLFLIYSPWKEIKAGQPASRELNDVAKLPWLGSTKVHIGLVIALAAAVAVWFVLKYTTWGFRLAVVGGNQEAARRAGLPVGWLLMSALLVGGALAGLAGMVHFAGVEYKLRGAFGLNIGYIGFLASWLARHRPLPVVIASFAFAAIIVAGDSLQLDSGLPAATVNVLTGLILIAVLGWTGPATHILRRKRVAFMSLIVDVLTGAVRSGTSIAYAGLGETVSERAGVINLGTEGCMLVGALGGYAITAESGNPWIGVVGGAICGALLSLIHAVLVVSRRANQFASGLTLYFFALGLTALYGAPYVGKQIDSMEIWNVPVLSEIPAIGPILFQQDPLTYLSFVLAPTVWFVLFRTRWGLLIRTAGERSDALTVHGFSVARTRYAAVTIGGALAGVGGAQMSVAYTSSWFENMIVGRGFIAVALVIFASWDPIRVLGGAYVFGAALALSPALQARGYDINQFALASIPFVLTLAVLALMGKRTLLAAPDELKRVLENAQVA